MLSSDRERDVARRFRENTAEHVMRIIHEDGLYRHIRFRNPANGFYYYDLVTWPGYLAIVGDAGDYVFARITDMFDFFVGERHGINPHYWAQKLQGRDAGRTGAKSYSHEVFAERLYQWCDDRGEWDEMYPSLLRGAVDRELLYDYTHSETEARERLRDIEDDLGQVFRDSWEWDFRDYDHQFLWCCWAIVHGIKLYRAAEAAKTATKVATSTTTTEENSSS